MRIQKHQGIKVAEKVIKELEKVIPKEIAKECSISCWSNCREQGYHLTYFQIGNPIAFNIAECRNSDNIIVQFGKYSEFNIQTNQGTEEIYRNERYFKYDDFKGAAEYINTKMLESTTKKIETPKPKATKNVKVEKVEKPENVKLMEQAEKENREAFKNSSLYEIIG